MTKQRMIIKAAIKELRRFIADNAAVVVRYHRLRTPAGQVVVADTKDGRRAAISITTA